MAKDMQIRTNAAKKKQIFSSRAPGATSVQLVGDFTKWQENPISLRKESDGIWRVSIDLNPGSHHYRFMVDGQWRDDPECSMHVPNAEGGQAMVRQVM